MGCKLFPVIYPPRTKREVFEEYFYTTLFFITLGMVPMGIWKTIELIYQAICGG